MAILVVHGPGHRGEKVEITGDRFVIGRSLEADLVLHDKTVSSRHAQVVCRRGEYWIQDLGSRNGTRLKDQKVVQERLSQGDEVQVGDYRLLFSQSAAQIDQETEASLEEIRRGLHAQLIAQLNLKQMSMEQMLDASLRERADQVLTVLLKEKRKEIPAEYDIVALKKSVLDSALGLGPLEDLLHDDTVTEIMVNAPDKVYIERNGRISLSKQGFLSKDEIMTAVERIVGPLGRRVDESSPLVDARLPDGSRVNIIIPPLSIDSPMVTVRKFPKKRMQIQNLIGFGALSQAMADFLRLAVVSRKNIIISGGTGSGKTTLLNVMASFIPDGERILTIEDSAELQLPQDHVGRLETRPPNIEGKGEFTIRDLVRNALRMRPDRIVVGECRGGEALDMIQAMNTGHDGSLTTAHANSPEDMVRRLETMVLMAGMDLPLKAVRENIFSAMDLIVQITRFTDGTRKLTSVAEFADMYEGEIRLQEIFRYERIGMDAKGRVLGEHVATGIIPGFVEDLRQAGIDVDMSLFVPRKAEDAPC